MIRYYKIPDKNPREIVLLKSRPCSWGRCFFCDYIHDNENSDDLNLFNFNSPILKNVTGEFGTLEVINSANVFELPKKTLEEIREICNKTNIKILFFESHYTFRHRLSEIREFFDGIEIIFKCGVETFDNHFRNEILNKGMIIRNPEDVAEFFDSICLMVGIKGQTREMIKYDMEVLQKYFKRACINIYTQNSTYFEEDDELVEWFKENYSHLESNEGYEILWKNTDFGVGGEFNE